MAECLFCQNEIVQKEGKKARQFCDGNCRNKYYYRLATADKEPKKIGRPKKAATKTFLTAGSSITNAETGVVIKNDSGIIQDITAQMESEFDRMMRIAEEEVKSKSK